MFLTPSRQRTALERIILIIRSELIISIRKLWGEESVQFPSPNGNENGESLPTAILRETETGNNLMAGTLLSGPVATEHTC